MSRAWIGVLGLLAAVDAGAEVLTADRAVQLALAHNLDVIRADATVLDAKAGVYSAWSSILPTFSLNLTKSDQRVTNETGFTQVAGNVVPILPNDSHNKSTIPSLSASWLGLRFSSWSNYSSAQGSLTAANRSLDAAKSEAALQARRGFYEVVKAVKLEGVAGGSLKLARDDERRVRALFEVGSVSRSDLLKAQVRTSQSELDSIVANHTVTARRNDLAILIGVKESELGDVDTVLTADTAPVDEADVLKEATASNHDLQAAHAELNAAKTNRTSARLARLPYVVLQGQVEYSPSQEFKNTQTDNNSVTTGKDDADRIMSGTVALRWDVFDGLISSARDASANARLRRAEESFASLQRSLAADVHIAVQGHRQAQELNSVAVRALESATENLKLTQEKYNVGSATILDLIDAQVQLQRAQSDGVSALAAIRVAEAQLNRVRGRAQ